MKRNLAAVTIGVLFSLFLLTIFVSINLGLMKADSVIQQNGVSSNDNPFILLGALIWRFDYIFNPLIVIGTTILVKIISAPSKNVGGLLALLPFLIFYLFSNSFDIRSISFVIFYVVLSIMTSLLFVSCYKKKMINDTASL